MCTSSLMKRKKGEQGEPTAQAVPPHRALDGHQSGRAPTDAVQVRNPCLDYVSVEELCVGRDELDLLWAIGSLQTTRRVTRLR